MKSVFLSGGARERALRYLLEKNEDVIAVVTPHLTEKNNRFKHVILTAIEYGIPVIPVTRTSLKNSIQSLNFDLLISCGFPYILEGEIIDRAKFAINVHPTLLPKYRGYRSGPYILINNEKKSGVSIHFLTNNMDQGDIILQKEFPISSFDTTKSVFRKCMQIEPIVLYEAIQKIKDDQIIRIPQNEVDATEYSYIRTPEDSEIDWNKPLKDLYNQIRACDPDDYPAFFNVEGQKVCIKLWRQNKLPDEEDMI